MKNVILCIMLLTPFAALADRTFETVDESRQRHEYERYQQYKDNNYQAPLGGYQEKLGDPAPYGTSSPGSYQPQQQINPNESWRDRLKR